MAEQKQEEHKRVGLIAMDGSEHSDYAFHCKYNFYFHFHTRQLAVNDAD